MPLSYAFKEPLLWKSEEAEVLTSVFFTAGAPLNDQPAAMTTGVITSPVLSVNEPASPNKDSSKPVMLIQDQQQEADVLDLLKQVVLVQKEFAHGQVQVIQKLSTFEKQVGPV